MGDETNPMKPASAEQSVFAEALQRATPEARLTYLDAACGTDTVLRRRVEALLRAADNAGDFLEHPPTGLGGDVDSTALGSEPGENPGSRIGRYKLLEKIGEGGCGVVYMAEQEEPVRRRVALKIIKLGMDTRSVVARFEAEQQALALMDHPNIAKVLDGGETPTGRLYFVMELVRGVRITKFCDEARLPPEARLRLFVNVCQALQHAHQKGIIHRDLKPSNILVTVNDGVPVPKVIDFGIAKAIAQKLTDKTLFTEFQALIGTPAYMSPEQAGMSSVDIDTRSDIYALGVLLYELLTGRTPFDGEQLLSAGLDEMRRIIRDEDPPRPSARLTTLGVAEATILSGKRQVSVAELAGTVRGDLDWIVMKCLDKNRARRYQTANDLALDIQRHLDSEPVAARPPSSAYRFQKLVRRNKLAFAAVAAVSCALVLGVVASAWQAVRATRARSEAVATRENEAQQRRKAEAQELAARQRAYSSDMTLAGQALEANNLGMALELVERQEPEPGRKDLRGWEWRHLWGRTRSGELFALRGHSDEVPIALFLHDGRTAFSGSCDRTLKFWNLEKCSVVETIPYPDDPRRAALSPDGRFLAVGGAFGYWSVWDAPSRRLLMARTNTTGVVGLTFSSTSLALAIADGLNVEVWAWPEPRLAKSFPRRDPEQGDLGFVVGLSFSPDNKKIAYAHADGRVVLHDLQSDAETTIGRVAGIAFSLAFSPDGRALASADTVGITIWDPEGQQLSRQLNHHREQVVCVAFSPDGERLASASGDQTIKLWDARNWQEITTLKGHPGEVHSVAFSPDGHSLISSGKDPAVRVWSVGKETGRRDSLTVADTSNHNFGRPNGERLLRLSSGSTAATFLDLDTLAESAPQAVPPVIRGARAVAFDRSSGFVAAALDNGPVEIWQTDPFSRLKAVARSEMPATKVALGETGHWLAVQRTNETTEIWDIERDRLVRRLEPLPAPVTGTHGYNGLSFWAADRCLVRATVAVRDLDAFLEIVTLPQGETTLIRSKHTGRDVLNNFALSEDGRVLATSGFDGQVRLVDARTGREIEALRGQLVGFVGLAFSPDGSRLAAGGWDGTITVWDVMTRQRVGHWKAHKKPCWWLSFVQGGRVIASSGSDYASPGAPADIRLWRAPSLEQIDAAEAKEKTEIKRP